MHVERVQFRRPPHVTTSAGLNFEHRLRLPAERKEKVAKIYTSSARSARCHSWPTAPALRH